VLLQAQYEDALQIACGVAHVIGWVDPGSGYWKLHLSSFDIYSYVLKVIRNFPPLWKFRRLLF